MDRKKKIFFYVVIGFVVLSTLAGIYNFFNPIQKRAEQRGPQVGVIEIKGVITDSTPSFLAAGGTVDVLEQLRAAQTDPSTPVILLRINSPGGSAAFSQEIYDEVLKLKDAGKKVIVSMGEVAASGGYWIATAADVIYANPATTTGSIGVISQFQNLTGLYDKLGIDYTTVKSGAHKDMGSPTRDLTEAELEIVQEMIDDMFQQFVDVIVEGRGLPREDVLAIADGRVFTGRQAMELGLVDKMGNFYDAVDAAGKMAGIEGRPRIKYYNRPSLFGNLFPQINIVIPSGEGVLSIERLLQNQLY